MRSLEKPRHFSIFAGGAAIGTLGGLIGLGGAEFRLPLLIGLFRFGALEAVILNKAMSLVVVAAALPFRNSGVPWRELAAHVGVIATLLSGSLIGAWHGAGWASRLNSKLLYRTISLALLGIAAALLSSHGASAASAWLTGWQQTAAGCVAGYGIGIVAALLGVAGGELLIPTIVLLFGVDIKIAGSLSLAVSLPTMLAGFGRYSRHQSFSVLGRQRRFIVLMAIGSIAGAFLGGQLLTLVTITTLSPLLASILVISAIKIWRLSQQEQ
ncbi:sulfite exporter TauE/SafE family protein [Methylomonas montana]|uniref:sulfite exporter TauE/SafE family protein n=1 Tax=Methylomonas montana TaxID=3058963 RepID=UPI00265B62D0|nr:sulfite exporter TauE/SafE family protein [Methylomonas montana]WKJ92118.1 sulfite exporter TauE/SafE family protein [Methylomonas montana]